MLSPDVCSMICTFCFSNFQIRSFALWKCEYLNKPARGEKQAKPLLIAMFYYICLLQSSRIYYCAIAAIMLKSGAMRHSSTQGLRNEEITDIFITAKSYVWKYRMLYGYGQKKVSIPYRKTCYGNNYRCVHLVLYHSWQFLVLYIIFACVIWGFPS